MGGTVMAVSKYTAKDGKIKWYFSVRYTDWTGERKRKKQEGFKTQRDAKEAETKFLNSCRTDITITFENLVEAYLKDCRVHIASTTMQTKEHIINTKILPYFANLPLNAIDVSIVRKWQNELITHEQGYSPTYLKTINNNLSAIFNYAMKYYKLPSNPARLCGSMGKKQAENMDFWTLAEFQQFIQATENDITAKTIFNLFFFSGIREGELLALTLNDFDFDKSTVSINKSYAVVKGEAVIKEPKTPKSKREVSLPSPLMDMIKEYSSKLYDYTPTQRLFPTGKTSLHRDMKKYCELSGVRKIRIHDLRHSHASLLIEMGVSPLQISERLGHEDIQTTLNIYSHLYPNKQGELADKLAQFM